MKHYVWAAGCLLAATVAVAAPKAKSAKGAKPGKAAAASATVTPRMENQFGTVDEFVKAARPAKTAASVEGYLVFGLRLADGSERLTVVDSVDHVLNATDANNFARAGAVGTLRPDAVKKHSGWAWSAKGLQRFVMYTGVTRAQKPLHDTVAKVRITGLTAGRAAINPVTRVEYQDDNGDWRTLP